MEELKFFMHRIKHTSDVYDKGIEVKDTLDEARKKGFSHLMPQNKAITHILVHMLMNMMLTQTSFLCLFQILMVLF